MLTELRVDGFKSLEDLTIELPPLALFVGPNAVGKSNLLDALHLLARIGTERTLQEAFDGPIRGRTLEAFTLNDASRAEQLERAELTLAIGGDFRLASGQRARYDVKVGYQPRSGRLRVLDEYLVELSRTGLPKAQPRIESEDGVLLVRRRNNPGRPQHHEIGATYTQLADDRHSEQQYPLLHALRRELRQWRTYYFDPANAMRGSIAPRDADDIGGSGELLAPVLNYLQETDPQRFLAVERAARTLIPSIDGLAVRLDPTSGDLDVEVTQRGKVFSTRVISEGTLRVLGLCAIAATAPAATLVALEEPENGVHPPQLERVARLLAATAFRNDGPQVLLTTHSPSFASALLKLARSHHGAALFGVGMSGGRTTVSPMADPGLFDETVVNELLQDQLDGDAGDRTTVLVEALMQRGWVGG